MSATVDLELTEEQAAFVAHREGPAVLHAPVGTGKTLCLAERAARAIQEGIPASRILCVTFTNLAAEQMRTRVLARCGEAGAGVVVRTFHALCAWVLRTEAKALGIPADFAVFDEEDAEELVGRLRRGNTVLELNSVKDLCQEIHHAKVDAAAREPAWPPDHRRAFAGLAPPLRALAEAYQSQLARHRALDFADLVCHVLGTFESRLDVRERWERRFDLVQVDEMQDTHLAEYLVVRTLARRARSVVLAGDFDQTIYEWRGSRPRQVLARFRRDFPGVVDFRFTENHRSTRRVLQVAAAVAGWFSSHPAPRPAAHLPEGEPVVSHFARDADAEADWIAQKLRQLAEERAQAGEPLPWREVGVLARTNHRAQVVARGLERAGIPHLTVEAYDFFRRQEVKDALAYLRVLVRPHDAQALARVLRRLPTGIGEATLAQVTAGEEHGLRLTDLVDPAALEAGDPFGPLLEALDHGRLVVLDTETTGNDPAQDDVVELGAVVVDRGRVVERLHRYVRPDRPVGWSQHVHGLDDAFLAEHGLPAEEVLAELPRLLDGAVVVAHNAAFDRRVLLAHARRAGVPLELPPFFDTLEAARRLVGGEDLSLAALCTRLGVEARPSHRALDDAEATLELLRVLRPMLERGAPERRRLVHRLRRTFEPLARQIAALRQAAASLRPPQLLDEVLERSGLRRLYEGDPRRMANLGELRRIFAERDDPAGDPVTSLEALLQFAALARNVDRLGPEDDRVRVLTVHQAKGLEFDVVVVAGLSEHEFPHYGSVKEGRGQEERRLFYVAVTRARRQLILTGHAEHEGRRRRPSPYLLQLAGLLVEEGPDVGRWSAGRPGALT